MTNEKDKYGSYKWLCKCDCGNIAYVRGSSLKSGLIRSCGCSRKEKLELTGKRFDRLLVTEYLGAGRWKCQCDCGKTVTCTSKDLTSGRIKSCGCYRKDKMTGQRVYHDISGNRFGNLTAIELYERKNNKDYWMCKCTCGRNHIAEYNNLIHGGIKSCGCLRKDQLLKHGKSDTRIYKIWQNMIARCYIESSTNYENYGGRGITVCSEWKEHPEKFIEWGMQSGYANNLTIDRIDVNGNYEPSNCRWASYEEQANNKRNTIYIEYNGKKQTLREWCDELELPYNTIRNRYKKKWETERMFTQPIRKW